MFSSQSDWGLSAAVFKLASVAKPRPHTRRYLVGCALYRACSLAQDANEGQRREPPLSQPRDKFQQWLFVHTLRLSEVMLASSSAFCALEYISLHFQIGEE